MLVSDFDFDLPDDLIARYPLPERTASRLLCLDGPSGECQHRQFRDLPSLLKPDDLLVFNNTRVIPARLFGQKATGGKLEILIERVEGEQSVLAHVRASKSPKPGSQIVLEDGTAIDMVERADELFRLRFPATETAMKTISRLGHMPLPPYIDREDDARDRERYQTVYGKKEGAVAAPTAGLHFDAALMDELKFKGITMAEVTLHVGAGTFQPVRVEKIEDHHMHKEYVEVEQSVVDAIAETRHKGGRVIAVGTTSVRSLEAASQGGALKPFFGDTDIFIFPGYQFNTVDAMITNFHLPQSTLLMLVSAFAGREPILAAYQAAVDNRYRFFSYGDAMFISRRREGVTGA